MRFEFLIDYPEFVNELNELFYHEWNFIYPEYDIYEWKERLKNRLNRKEIPTTIIAVEGNDVLGSTAIVKNDMRTRQELSPWLAGLYVKEKYRRKGLGSRLVLEIEKLSRELRTQKLYLYTPDQEKFYKRLNWENLEKAVYQGIEVTIMTKEL